MKQAITLFIVFPFMVFFMFQPFLSEVVHMRGILLEQMTDKYTKLAAREGYLSPGLIQMLEQELEQFHFDTSKLQLGGTVAEREVRGSVIHVTLRYPIGNMFILLNWFGEDTSSGDYSFHATTMSEFIP